MSHADGHGSAVKDTSTTHDHAAHAGVVRSVRVARQGIYGPRRELVSYELLFHADDSAQTSEVAAEQATSQVIASTFGTFGLDAIADGKPVFINFTRAFLTGVIPIPVAAESVILEIVAGVDLDHELLLGLAALRGQEYRIAVSNYRGEAERSALLEIADFVKIPLAQIPSLVVPGLVQQVRYAGATMVATGIEDAETFNRAVELGFELFQGSYLQRPMTMERRTLSPSQLICVRLLNDLSDPAVSIARIEQMVGSDPGLTLRLLRTANSADSGSTTEVTTLRQALVLVGPRRLRAWVVLTLLEGGTNTNTSDDLWSVLARAHACQRLGGPSSELAFTIGLLSGAADLLGADPESVAEGSGLGHEAVAALVDGAGSAGRALRAVLAHEQHHPEIIEELGLAPFEVSRAYLESLSESLQLVHDLVQH